MPSKSPNMIICWPTTNYICPKETTVKRKSPIWLNNVKYKSPIASVTWLTRKEKRYKPLIRSVMVRMCWLRNGKQNQIDETEPVEPEKRRAGDHNKTHYAPKPPTHQLARVSEQTNWKDSLQEWGTWSLYCSVETTVGNPQTSGRRAGQKITLLERDHQEIACQSHITLRRTKESTRSTFLFANQLNP